MTYQLNHSFSVAGGSKLAATALLSLWCGLSGVQAFAAGEKPVEELAAQQAWKQTLIANKGVADQKLIQAFVAAAKTEVLAKVKAGSQKVDPELLKIIDSNPAIERAVYAAIYPVDPNCLLNMQDIYKQLGKELFVKYIHLATGASVARRTAGVGEIANPSNHYKISQVYDVARPRIGTIGREKTAEFLKERGLREVTDKPLTSGEKEMMKAVSALVAKSGKQLHEIWEDDSVSVMTVLEPYGVKKNDKKNTIKVLTMWLRETGKIPKRRSSAMSIADYIRKLDGFLKVPEASLNFDKIEKPKLNKMKLKWPVLDSRKAPWPLLMPLALSMPGDEMDYIWDKYNGKHGDKRVILYGNYRKVGSDGYTKSALQPADYHLSSWPGIVDLGGACGSMSQIAHGTYISLGVPSMKVGQPHHSAGMVFKCNTQGKYYAHLYQSSTQLMSSKTTNFFRDAGITGRGPSADKTFALPFAMNFGLDRWMSSRILYHMYQTLSPEDRAAFGDALLYQAIHINAYNLRPWYQLFMNSGTEADKHLNVLELIGKYFYTEELELDDLEYIHKRLAFEELGVSEDRSAVLPDLEENRAVTCGMWRLRTALRDAVFKYHIVKPEQLNKEQQARLLSLNETYWKKDVGFKQKEFAKKYVSAVLSIEMGGEEYTANVKEFFFKLLEQPANTHNKKKRRSEHAYGITLSQAESVLGREKARVLMVELAEHATKVGANAYEKPRRGRVSPRAIMTEVLKVLASTENKQYNRKAIKKGKSKGNIVDEFLKNGRKYHGFTES